MAGPYDPPASDFVHKYLNNQSLVPNQGLDSADPNSYHCCCFHSFGEVDEEGVDPGAIPVAGQVLSRHRHSP